MWTCSSVVTRIINAVHKTFTQISYCKKYFFVVTNLSANNMKTRQARCNVNKTKKLKSKTKPEKDNKPK